MPACHVSCEETVSPMCTVASFRAIHVDSERKEEHLLNKLEQRLWAIYRTRTSIRLGIYGIWISGLTPRQGSCMPARLCSVRAHAACRIGEARCVCELRRRLECRARAEALLYHVRLCHVHHEHILLNNYL